MSGEFAERHVARADSALVADAHAVAPMGNPTSSTWRPILPSPRRATEVLDEFSSSPSSRPSRNDGAGADMDDTQTAERSGSAATALVVFVFDLAPALECTPGSPNSGVWREYGVAGGAT